jgi:Tfp pilus assembly PilM family ATPase
MASPASQKRLREAWVRLALQPRQLAKSLSRGLPGGGIERTAVASLDGHWLKLIIAEGPRNARAIVKVLACPVQGANPDEIQQRVRQVCAAEQAEARDVLLANPTHLCTIRIFALPSTDPKEIRDIVELQAEKHTPYAKNEILTDFLILERERSGYSRVLLVIAHQDVVHRGVRLVEAAGWGLDRVGCELEGLVAWTRLAKAALKSTADTTLTVDVDGNTTIFLVTHKGQAQFQRSLATGVEQLEADPAQAGGRLVGELQRSIEALDAEGSSLKIQEVLLTGPVDRLAAFKAQIEQGLDLPVRLVPPWQAGALSPEAASAAAKLPEISFASLIGLTAEPGALDLTPQTTKLRQAFESRAKALVQLGCQGLAALILISLLFIGRAHKQERYFHALRTVHQSMGAEAAVVQGALEQLIFVEDQLRRRGLLLKAIDTLAKLSPPEIQWNTLAYTAGEAVVLSGTADALPKVYEFSGSVGNSPLFQEVETRRVAKRQLDDERDVTDFELRCPLPGAEEPS